MFVWLSACLLMAILHRVYWIDIRENITTYVSVDKEKLVEFWKSSASGFRSRNFLKDSSTLRDWAFFHSLAHSSGETERIFITDVSLEVIWIRSESGYGLRIWTRCTALAEVCTLRMLLFRISCVDSSTRRLLS